MTIKREAKTKVRYLQLNHGKLERRSHNTKITTLFSYTLKHLFLILERCMKVRICILQYIALLYVQFRNFNNENILVFFFFQTTKKLDFFYFVFLTIFVKHYL